MLTRMSACHKVNQQSVLKPLLHRGISQSHKTLWLEAWLFILLPYFLPSQHTHVIIILFGRFIMVFLLYLWLVIIGFIAYSSLDFCLNRLNETSGGF